MKPKLLLLGVIPLLFGCTEKIDFNNLDKFNYKGEWIAPVINANLKLENILANDSNFVIDPDGGLRIIYVNDSLFSQSTADLAKIPDQDPQEISLPSDAPPFLFSTELGTLAGAKIKNVTVLEGKFEWKIDNPSSQPASVEFAVLNATHNGDTAKFILNSTGLGETTGVIDIAGLDFDFTVGSTGYNALNYRMRILNNGGAATGTIYDMEIKLTDIIVEDAIPKKHVGPISLWIIMQERDS